ncbi:unnamed protein product [Dovyalis caffra]|uniref:Uncharacterized protein n=1 Tax=Dovyalis caffra TaxID=77055 RepID=A0AAV1RQ62_9ROSI|nr:unnamed protein product [Dovyalis caffra]
MAAISEPNSPSLTQKLKSTFCLSPFRKHNHHHRRHHVSFSAVEKDINHEMLDDQVVQEEMNVESREDVKVNKTSFLSRTGKHGHGHRRRHSVSADFHYDPTSYALNFDEGQGSDNGTHGSSESPLRSFSSRHLCLSKWGETIWTVAWDPFGTEFGIREADTDLTNVERPLGSWMAMGSLHDGSINLGRYIIIKNKSASITLTDACFGGVGSKSKETSRRPHLRLCMASLACVGCQTSNQDYYALARPHKGMAFGEYY